MKRRVAMAAAWALTAAGATAAQHEEGVPVPQNALTVHLCQANNDSPYALVRARFEPGEVSDPWAVRFFEADGKEVPYFVWDAVTWKVAREGRADWGHRYALLNHGPGNAPEVLEARSKKLEWARKSFPELGERLAAQDDAAKKSPDSLCAALYLLHCPVPAYGKHKLTLRLYPTPQVEPKRWKAEGLQVGQRTTVQASDLRLENLPDRLTVAWRGKALYRYAGFEAGGVSEAHAHVDPSRPFALHVAEGLITKVCIEGKTKGPKDGELDWQCAYWLFPDGAYVALEGFSPSARGYLGGEQKLSIFEGESEFRELRGPLWEADWWVHQIGDRGFAALHLFYGVPLTVGYGNNPFTVNPEGDKKRPALEADGNRLGLRWNCSLKDAAIGRLFAPQEAKEWAPRADWLYRQYAVGIGSAQADAEAALRRVIGAAAGWVDRPFDEEQLARALVQMMRNQRPTLPQSAEGPLQVLPYLLNPDPASLAEALRGSRDMVAQTDRWITEMRAHVAAGGNPVHGRRPELAAKGLPCEGWVDNPAYHASWLPTYTRFREHFRLAEQQEHRDAVLRYADFSLEHIAGNPVDFEKLHAAYLSQWPNRFVMIIPLMLHAYGLKPEEKYRRAAVMLFDELMEMVERNPHGYWSAWTFRPKDAAIYDSTYNPVGYQRGITAFWAERRLDFIGPERAARFAAAQARYFVFSAQLLDTLEMDSVTAIRATTHGGHPNFRQQISLYLYDDYPFYRGLLGNLVHWAAANPHYVSAGKGVSGSGPYRTLGLHYFGAWTLRWALGVGPGTRYLEHTLQKLQGGGFRVRLRNGLPWTCPTLWLRTDDVGLERLRTPKGTLNAPVVWLRLTEPAFRKPAELEVVREQGEIRARVSHHTTLRLYPPALNPNWKAGGPLALTRQAPDGAAAQVVEGAEWSGDSVEWEAEPGEYRLKAR